jgi:hypothetical protein
MRLALALFAAALILAAPSQAATVSVRDGTLQVRAEPGEQNAVDVTRNGPASVSVRDAGALPWAGRGCEAVAAESAVSCRKVRRIRADLGDANDTIRLGVAISGRLQGGSGDDQLRGGRADDVINDLSGRDLADGGGGDDRIRLGDRLRDQATCGTGSRDQLDVESLRALDFGCERVDLGSPRRVRVLLPSRRPRRFVRIPGQHGQRIDRRLLPDVVELIRRYKVRVIAGFAMYGHKPLGEHPLGLAVDLVPQRGHSWRGVDRLARWAEPVQNHPRAPFRWVGYNGDEGHGRGNHLHLSWLHTPEPRGHPVGRVWTWRVSHRR